MNERKQEFINTASKLLNDFAVREGFSTISEETLHLILKQYVHRFNPPLKPKAPGPVERPKMIISPPLTPPTPHPDLRRLPSNVIPLNRRK